MRSLNRMLFFVMALFVFGSCQKDAAELISLDNNFVPVAEAGPSKSIMLPVSTTTLTGSGTSKNGPIVGYLWSLISGPNVPVINTPSSPTTTISGLTTGNYNFQFMVIDSLGYTGVDTAWVRVSGTPPPVTLTLQPSANPVELNFAARAGGNVSSHDIDLDACAWTWGGDPLLIRGATKFDLTGIPATATIVSAKLTLYSNPTPVNGDLVNANSGSDNSMWIRRLTSAFTTSSTWATQPATETSTQVLIPHTAQPFFDLIDIDVTNIVNSMRTNGNYGFMMGLQNESIYNIRQFASSMHSNAAKHPKLVVVYQP